MYNVGMCVCDAYHASHINSIRKKLFRGAQEVDLSGPTNSAHSTTNWRNVTEATIELLQQRSSNTEI